MVVKKIMYYIFKYQVATTMILALFLFALFAISNSEAHASEIEAKLESHTLSFDAKCIRGDDSAELWTSSLIESWDEMPVFMGTNDGGRIIIMRNSYNPTWTLLMQTAEGTCLITSGGNHFLNDVDGTAKKFPSKKERGDLNDDRI